MSRCFLLPLMSVLSLLLLSLSISIPILTVNAQSGRDVVEVQGFRGQIPATGTFTLRVNYVATGSRALVAEVQLKANQATKVGRGNVVVNGGTGLSTITVTLSTNPAPTPSATAYEISLWSVDSATYNNGNNPNAFNQRTSNTRYNVVLGTPTTAPPATLPPPSMAPGQTPRPGTPTPPPDLIIPTLPPSDPSDPTLDPNNPGTDPNNPDSDPSNPDTDPNTPPLNARNSAAAPQQMICWTILMVLGVIGSSIL